VQCRCHVVEVFRRRGAQGFEAEVVQDEQVGAKVELEATFEGPVGASTVDVLQHTVGIDEQDVVSSAASLVGEGLGQVRLTCTAPAVRRRCRCADTGGSADEHIALLADIDASG